MGVAETSVRLAEDLIPAMVAGKKTVTIRKGKREFAPEIDIAGYPAIADSVEYYTLSTCPLDVLVNDGFHSFQDTVDSMKRFYPDITPDTEVTVLRFHLKATNE
jgi:hypothetical protein